MRQIYIFVTVFFLCQTAIAGFNGLTYHSRANCVNNESISWDATSYHELLTVSDHLYRGRVIHSLASGWEDTWRSANVHWGEAAPGAGWHVQAGHYISYGGTVRLLGYTTADDCSIYDGWWDRNFTKPYVQGA